MIILSAFFFACMNVSVRLAGDLPSVEKSFFRNLVAAVFAAVILCKNRTVPKVDKKYWGPLILRCVCGTLGILCNFYAIDHLLVADASILNKLSPFFAIIFSFLLLKEKIRPTQAACVALAFIGCLFVVKPGFQNAALVPALIGFQKCIDHCGIGLCSANQQEYFCLRRIAGFSDLFFRIFCVWILTIAHCFLQVCLHQLLHDRRMCTLHVVTGEI